MNLLTVLLSTLAGIEILSKALGVAVAVVAAAFGISKIGNAAVEGIARQPEAGSDIRTSLIIASALIEGAALFAIVVCGFIL